MKLENSDLEDLRVPEIAEVAWGNSATQSDLSTDLFETVLRVHREPLEYFDERRVHEILVRDPRGYLSYLKSQLLGIAQERIRLDMPPKQIFTDEDGDTAGDFRLMPCVVREGDLVRKTIKIVGTNLRQQTVPDQITVGKSFVIHPQENFISHVFEACLLSSARTGACAALAVSLLADSPRRVTVIGAGRVGYYGALFMAAGSQVDRLTFQDLDIQRALNTAAHLQRQFPEIQCGACSWDELQREETDVLVLATDSREAIYGPQNFPAGLIVSLGADADTQRELDPAWATEGKLFVDTLDTARYGDLQAWLRDGLIDLTDLTDLMTILRNPVLGRVTGPKIFISTGTALFDNLTMGYLLNGEGPKESCVW